MRPTFYPRLINDPFDDPGLYIPFLFENRAMMFDLGENTSLSPRDMLKLGHVFVSHTHMDHFIGFDRLLRLFLGRDRTLHFYGPEGFMRQVEGKLSGYQWNLVDNFSNSVTCEVTEVHSDTLLTGTYRCRDQFRPCRDVRREPFDGRLYSEPALAVSAVILDHHIPCLGFSIEEQFHINIKKDALTDMGLDVGPWLKSFKRALYQNTAPDWEFDIFLKNKETPEKKYTLGELADHIAHITPGQKVTYITDVVYSKSNVEKIVSLAENADQLFIEAAFLEKDRNIAREKCHLTAWQAGRIARKAEVKQFFLFHFSPRYNGRADGFLEEALRAYEYTGCRISSGSC